jgi:hypothetical protein
MHLVQRGQKESRRHLASAAQRHADITAVGIGKPDIQYENIQPLVACEQPHSLRAVMRHDGFVLMHAQAIHENPADRGIAPQAGRTRRVS